LVIETRFTGAGTNFAWVVPFPAPPVIEAATTGLFPTLQYLCRPEIVHEVRPYYVGVLLTLAFGFLLWRAPRSLSDGLLLALFLILLAALLLPALSSAKMRSMAEPTAASANVSVLDRQVAGIFETTTISSRDPKALAAWLQENGFVLATNAGPVIASYVHDGWVFVASKVRRESAGLATSTPHPLSFTFKTSRPVYPMRLTGLAGQTLSVDLYVLGSGSATAQHFSVQGCSRMHFVHPELRAWFGESKIVTKLTATLSPVQLRQDVWVDLSPGFFPKANCLYSRRGAFNTALNWSTAAFALGLLLICRWPAVHGTRSRLWREFGAMFASSLLLLALIYVFLPKTEVKLVRGQPWSESRQQQFALLLALDDATWQTPAEAHAALQTFLSDPASAATYRIENFDNPFLGGRVHEEDSPGNYLLRETNHQLEVVFIHSDGGEEIGDRKDLGAVQK
ncbi:MAG TPA: DUF2330 domain-containing protein, partial [Verrucomicrobiae bacterium]